MGEAMAADSASLHVFEMGDCQETVIAKDVADAWAVLKEQTGCGPEDYEGDDFQQLPDDLAFGLACEDEPADSGWPNNDGWEKKPNGFWASTRTCAEWCALGGRGHLGSNET